MQGINLAFTYQKSKFNLFFSLCTSLLLPWTYTTFLRTFHKYRVLQCDAATMKSQREQSESTGNKNNHTWSLTGVTYFLTCCGVLRPLQRSVEFFK